MSAQTLIRPVHPLRGPTTNGSTAVFVRNSMGAMARTIAPFVAVLMVAVGGALAANAGSSHLSMIRFDDLGPLSGLTGLPTRANASRWLCSHPWTLLALGSIRLDYYLDQYRSDVSERHGGTTYYFCG
jgi:hypothetical protein